MFLAALQLLLSAALAFAALAGLVTSSVVTVAVERSASWAPARRHRLLVLLALFPALFGASAFFAASFRALLALIWPEYDHCLVHPDVHVHICFVHPPHHLGNWGSCVMLLAALAWVATKVAFAGAELKQGRRWLSRLLRHANYRPDLDAQVLPVAAPLCLLVGFFRSVVVVSKGLVDQVDEEDLRVILSHERAHAARRDVLFRWVARFTTLFMLPGARATLLDAIELTSEQSCDDAAARTVGDRLRVAETILKVERLCSQVRLPSTRLAVSFGGHRISERVTALLEPQRRVGNLSFLMSSLALSCCSILAASPYVHHWTESLLAALTH